MPGLSLRWTGLFSFMYPPPPRLSEKSRREQKSLYPYTGTTTNFQSSLGELLLLRQSPPPQVSARVFSGRISGVCLQGCIQGASQVFVCKGVFGAHLRCLQLTGTVIGPVSAQGTLNRSLPDVITPPKGHPSILYGHQTALTVPANCKRQRQPH